MILPLLLLACEPYMFRFEGADPGSAEGETFRAPEDEDWIFPLEPVELELTLSDGAVAELTGTYDELNARDAEARGTLVTPYGDIDEVKVELKGKEHNSWQPLDSKPYLQLGFEADHDGAYPSGLRTLRLYNLWQDTSQVQGYLGFKAWRDAGYPTPRVGFARLTLNGVDLGLYSTIEAIDDGFFEDRPDAFSGGDGKLYEGEYGADLSADRADAQSRTYLDLVEQRSGDDGDRRELDTLARVVDDSVDFEAELGPLMPTDRLHLYLALEMAVGAREGYSWIQNNWYLYIDPSSGEATMLPWGFDQALYDLTIWPDDASALLPTRGDAQAPFFAAQCDATRAVLGEDGEPGLVDYAALADELDLVAEVLDASGIDEHPPFTELEVRQMRASVHTFLEERPDQLAGWVAERCL